MRQNYRQRRATHFQSIPYIEVSAKENIGIDEAFNTVLEQAIAQKMEEEEFVPEVIDLNEVKPATKEKCNC